MLYCELPLRNQMQIVDAFIGKEPEDPVTEQDKEVLQQWADDPRNFAGKISMKKHLEKHSENILKT